MGPSLRLAVVIAVVIGLARTHSHTINASASSPTQTGQLAGSEPATPDKLIRSVLARYVSGLEERNLDAIKRIWPTMTPAQVRAIQAEFDHARALRCELLEPHISIKDDTAVVVARRKYTLTTHEGKTFESTTVTTFNMRHGTNGWVIETIRYEL